MAQERWAARENATATADADAEALAKVGGLPGPTRSAALRSVKGHGSGVKIDGNPCVARLSRGYAQGAQGQWMLQLESGSGETASYALAGMKKEEGGPENGWFLVQTACGREIKFECSDSSSHSMWAQAAQSIFG